MRTVILSADQIPIGQISVQEAIVKILLGKAYAIEHYADVVFRSQRLSIPAPQVIAVYRGVKLPARYYGAAPLTNRNLFLRDGYCCQYCGRRVGELSGEEFLTRDHIMPVSRGGKDIWTNVVASCVSCNNKKGDSTPEEAGLELQTNPVAPNRTLIYRLSQERKTKGTVPAVAR